MFGFLKNLLRRPPEDSANGQSAHAEDYSSSTAMYYPEASSQQAAPRPGAGQPNGKGVDLPLQSVINNLPLELQPRVRMTNVGDMTITVPLEKILAQLSRGAVKISFGELRQAVPEVFTEENDRDRVLVALPLSDILARLNPALISRRRVQRQVQVPEEISSPFDEDGNGLVFSASPGKPEKAVPPPPPVRQTAVTPVAPKAPSRSTLTSVPTPAAPGTTPPPPAPRIGLKASPIQPPPSAPPAPSVTPASQPLAPAAPIAFRAPSAPKPPSAPVPPPQPIPMPGARPPVKPPTPTPERAPVLPTRPAPVAKPAPKPEPKPEPVEAAQPPAFQTPASKPATPPPAPTKAGTAAEPLVVPLNALADAWPDAVRTEAIEMNLVDAKVALPLVAAEQGLKQGRIAFSWKTIRSWIKPAIQPGVSAHDGTVLELPLKVVAPLFLARQKDTAKPHQKVSIDEDIPNLFFGFPQAESGIPAAQATARPADTNFYVWDDASDSVKVHEAETRRGPTLGTKFVAKYATPNEVVSRAAGLEGVNGALIALPDGLMVANRLPPDVNADTLAAFLPQIFGKVSQCTRELRMGDLNNLNFTVGNVPWKIFRVNSIFFAAFGRAGEPLPTAQLAALAGELDHNNR